MRKQGNGHGNSTPILIAHVSDLHAGGTTALSPPRIRLDDGGEYVAHKTQVWLWERWGDFWRHAAIRRKVLGARLYIVFNGDLVEGDHHGTTQIMSGNPNAQAAALNAAMEAPLALEPDKLFIVRGTAAHAGKSGSAEERIADGLRRDKRPVIGDRDTGAASWWHLYLACHGVRIDIAHHGRTGLREHTRGSQAVLHAHDILLSYIKRQEDPPHLCLRGHHHKFNDSTDACPVRVVTGGAWQFATEHIHKIATDSVSDIGGLLVAIQPDSTYTVEKVHYQPERGKLWRSA